MWIQVRSMDGQNNVRIDNLSKLTKIEDLREKLVDHFNAEPERQRLFFRGKQVNICQCHAQFHPLFVNELAVCCPHSLLMVIPCSTMTLA